MKSSLTGILVLLGVTHESRRLSLIHKLQLSSQKLDLVEGHWGNEAKDRNVTTCVLLKVPMCQHSNMTLTSIDQVISNH